MIVMTYVFTYKLMLIKVFKVDIKNNSKMYYVYYQVTFKLL